MVGTTLPSQLMMIRGLRRLTPIRAMPVMGATHAIVPLRRTAVRHPGRAGLMLALAVAAPAMRGSLGVLAAILAGMLLVDAIVPIPGTTWSEADDHFWAAVHARRRAGWRRRLGGLTPERLPVLDESDTVVAAAPRRALGVQVIALDSIAATVEASKANAFDARLRPERSAHERWRSVWIASSRGVPLPPISVYRLGRRHVVRDGHYRLSVAHHLGYPTIEADVVELVVPDEAIPWSARHRPRQRDVTVRDIACPTG